MNPVRVIIELKRKYTYTVTVKEYIARVRAGELPRVDAIKPQNFGSWVKRRRKDRDHDRVFGFQTHDELIAFKKKYGLNNG